MINEIRYILAHDAQTFWNVIGYLIAGIAIIFSPPLIILELGYLRVLKFWVAGLLLAVTVVFAALIAYTFLFYSIPQTGG